MFKKIIFATIGTLSALFILAAYGQSFFQSQQKNNGSPNSNNSSNNPLPPISGKILPPDDFSSQVSKQAAKDHADFKQRFDQKAAAPVSKQPQGQNTTAATQSTNAPSAVNPNPTAPAANAAPPETTPAPSEAPPTLQPPPTTSAPTTQSTQSNQSQPYTGFQSQTQSNDQKPASKNSSSTWDIKY